ncbi:Hypothetical protein PENO1_050340 [Penicillium occitanis (nom. inval.)]|nr:Hypothetical protein PENO1_050340 [Penicillium occitanis (nom. inval.)]
MLAKKTQSSSWKTASSGGKGARSSDSASQVMGLAVKAQLYAAHAILEKRVDEIHEKVVSAIEANDDEDPDDLVVRLVDMYSRETVKSRSDWLDALAGMKMSELRESSRVYLQCLAACKTELSRREDNCL